MQMSLQKLQTAVSKRRKEPNASTTEKKAPSSVTYSDDNETYDEADVSIPTFMGNL